MSPALKMESNPNHLAGNMADALRDEILACEDGAFLGSEADLLERFKVNRLTFRQTARLLEQEQILTVRRGPGGGYFARKPGAGVTRRAVATYLRSRGITSGQLSSAVNDVSCGLVRCAALSKDVHGREHDDLAALRAKIQNVRATDIDRSEVRTVDIEFGKCVAKLAANPALELFFSSLYFTVLQQIHLSTTPRILTRRIAWRALRLRLADAILAGEPEVAEALTIRSNNVVLEWRAEDEARA